MSTWMNLLRAAAQVGGGGTPPPPVFENVMWTNLSGVSVISGNRLQKTGASGWNAGATSTKSAAGDFIVRWIFENPAQTTANLLGFVSSPGGYGYGNSRVEYDIRNNIIFQYDNGNGVGNPNNIQPPFISAGEYVEIKRASGIVTLHTFGVQRMLHPYTLSGSVYLRTTMFYQNTELPNIEISGFS